jgi:hypothetical protein
MVFGLLAFSMAEYVARGNNQYKIQKECLHNSLLFVYIQELDTEDDK